MKELHSQAGKDGYELQKAWKHNQSLSRNSRSNHVLMVRQGWIPLDSKFNLVSDDGKVFSILTPHDIVLPPNEFIGCNCELVFRMKKASK